MYGGKIMKIKISNAMRYIVACAILAGCSDNSISLDINDKGVYTKQGNGIYYMSIEEDGLNYMIYDVELRKDSVAVNVFYFNRNNPSYKVTTALHPKEMQMINLKPFTRYTIENHSNGDRNGGCVTFKTDSFGRPLVDTYKELNTVDEIVSHMDNAPNRELSK